MVRPEYVLGYQGTPLHYVDGDTAMAICGNALCQYSLTGGRNSHLMWGQTAGLQTSAFHPREHCIAFAEKGLQPAVHVHDIRNENKEIATLTELAELEILVLAFSAISWRLVTASGEPDFRLVLWDLNPSKGVTKMIEGKLDDAINYASFCPTSIDRVCVSGNGQISIWIYEQSFHITKWTQKILQCDPHHQPHCHAWDPSGEILYAGCMKGEVLSFDVKWPFPKPGSPEEAAGFQRKLLITLEDSEKIVSLCVGENHLVVVGMGGSCHWVGFPVRVKKVKPLDVVPAARKARGKRGVKIVEVVEDEYEPLDPAGFRIVEDLHLGSSMFGVTNAQYRRDKRQLLVGSSSGSITTVKVNVQDLQAHLTARPGDTPEKVQKLVHIEWQSGFHSGSILGMGIISKRQFLVTCGKDGTVRVWSADWGKELSRQCFKSPQMCLCISQSNGIVATGSTSGAINVININETGRSNLVNRTKLHQGSIDRIIFHETDTLVLAASKQDGRIFFLLNKSTEYDDLELLGFTVMNDPVLALVWDTKAGEHKDHFVLVSLARGEIVKLKVPTRKPHVTEFQFQHTSLHRVSFRVGAALNVMHSAKYYMEKEKLEKRIIWGFGEDKKLLQYRLPESPSQWTGPEATPQNPHFNVAGHHKPGSALMLLLQDQILVSGATDGTLQIRSNVLDPYKPPQKTLEVQMYDFYMGGMTCLAVHNGIIFTGGENGVVFAVDCSDAGLKRASVARSDMSARGFPPTEHPVEDPAEQSAVEKHYENVETKYMLAGKQKRIEMKATIRELRQEFQNVYEENNRAPPLEKLTAKEMIVDADLEAELRAVLDKQVEEAREEVRISDLNKDILAERIKEECWTVMAAPGTAVWPFGKGYEVWSFPLLGKPAFDTKKADLAKFYRHVEMYEHHYMKRLQKELAEIAKRLAAEQAAKEATELAAQQAEIDAANALAFGPPPGARSDANSEADKASQGSRLSERSSMASEMSVNLDNPEGNDSQSHRSSMAPRASMRSSVRESMVAGSETEASSYMDGSGASPNPAPPPKEPEEEEEFDEELEISESAKAPTFLYTSFELTTSKRKRTQCLLLLMQLKDIRVAFNNKLAEARSTKKSHISRIAEMKCRILDLHKMLSQPGVYPWPDLNEVTNGMPNVFEIKKEEVLVEKHLNKAERARAEELRLFEEQQEKLRAGDNAAERALVDMMGGILEKKLEVAAKEEEITRPKWMEGNPKKFTKDQHLEIKAFDAMLKQIKEDKEKKIRGQEAEQKKLRADVDEICNSFNNEMEDLFQQRLMVEARCTGMEESISRLSVAIEVEEVVDEKTEASMGKNMDRLKALKAQSVSSFTDFKREVDAFEEKLNAAVNEDKLQDKNFRKHFSDCGDVVNLLYRKFKDRPSKRKDDNKKAPTMKKESMKQTSRSSSFNSPSRSPSRRVSKTSSFNKKMSMGTITTIVVATSEPAVDPFYERPQEVTIPQWERLLDARKIKMAQEEEVNKLTTIKNSMGSFLAELTEADEANHKQIESCLRAMADFRDSRERRRKNLELILIMTSGYVEAILNPLHGDYIDVALMPRVLIEDFNKVILHEANTKIEMLLAARTFKAENHGVQWEIEKNHVRQLYVIEKIRALQLLRITKAMQQVIKTGEDPAAASESLALELRYEHNIRIQNHRIKNKNYVFDQIQKKIDEIKEQNAKLLAKAKLLHLEHNFQNRLCSSGLAAQQKEAALEARFRALYVKRQLQEMVKEQHDKILGLGSELLKTRNRILPALQEADMSGYGFPLRPLHSAIGREVLEANEEYFQSIRGKRRPTATHGHK